MSELKVDKITPRLGTTLTLGDSGDTINFGSGVLPNFENLTVTGDLTVDTNSLKVDSTNNFVGIGTATPAVALDVVGAITATGNITGTLATAAQPNITSVGTLTSATVSGDLTVDTTTLKVDSSNNRVAINKGTAGYTLDVNGDIRVGVYNAPRIIFMDTANEANSFAIKNNNSFFTVDAVDASGAFVQGIFLIERQTSEAMRLTSTGLGIGTSSPSALIHTSGTSIGTEIYGKFSTGSLTGDQNLTIQSNSGRSFMGLQVKTGGAAVQPLGLNPDGGNVGIGTSSPTDKLQVDAPNSQVRLRDTDDSTYVQLSQSASKLVIRQNTLLADHLSIGSSELVINDTSNDYDFRVESNTETHALFVDGGNNVIGVGTSAPDSPIHVKRNTTSGSQLLYPSIHLENESTVTSYAYLQLETNNGATDGGILAYVDHHEVRTNQYLTFRTGASPTERMRIDSSGNVGIGTSNPATRLHLQLGSSGATANVYSTAVLETNNPYNVLQFMSPNTDNQQIRFGDPQSNGAGIIQYAHNGNHMSFITDDIERMRIDSSGNVSIGKNSSAGKSLELYASTNTGMRIQNSTTGTTSSDGLLIEMGGSDALIYNYENGVMKFGTNNAERMRIDSSGNLLLGGTSTSALDGVSGIVVGSSTASTAGIAFESSAHQYLIYSGSTNDSLIFYDSTNDSERMRIDSSGRALFSTTGTNSVLNSSWKYQMRFSGASDAGLFMASEANANATGFIQFNRSSTTGIGSITRNGTADSVNYNTTSDYRMKENVIDLSDATTRVKQLQPKRFSWISQESDTATQDGFIAHEVQSIVPEAVTGTKDEVEVWKEGEELPEGVSVGDNKLDDEGNTIPVYQGIDQSKLVPLLVATIKELEARIEALENA